MKTPAKTRTTHRIRVRLRLSPESAGRRAFAEEFLAGDARTAGGTASRRLCWAVIAFTIAYFTARTIIAALAGGYMR